MKTLTIEWLNKCRCGNKLHTVKTARGNESALWDDDAVKCNSCGRSGVIQVYEGQARVLWETNEEMADGKPMSTITREQLRERAREKVKGLEYALKHPGAFAETLTELEEELELARIALASLEAEIHSYTFEDDPRPLYTAPPAPIEAEPVAYADPQAFRNFHEGNARREWMWKNPGEDLIPLFTAPPAPEPVNAEPVAWLWSHRKHPSEVTLVRPEDDEKAEAALWSGWSCQALYAAPSVPASVPGAATAIRACMEEFPESVHDIVEECAAIAENACSAAMLHGAEPVTTKADGGRSEKDEPPERGWVVTHSGMDYFYREQKDAATHMNAAIESGRRVSLRSLIPEPVTTAYKLPFEQWLSQQTGTIDVECGCVMTEVFFHWLRVAYEAGNSPVIPDGWVACSERMPEEGQEVIVMDTKRGKVQSGMIYQGGRFIDFNEEYFEVKNPPYWMPLPAAPQQEAKPL
ncbi:hypothetical protein A0R60_0246 [Enterobacter asburiae]|nr:hypothetical protein A0R60_0246 [Enterobacter asburiae]